MNSRNNYFGYKDEGDLQVSKCQCNLCKNNNYNDKNKCKYYEDGKPERVVKNQVMCKHFED